MDVLSCDMHNHLDASMLNLVENVNGMVCKRSS